MRKRKSFRGREKEEMGGSVGEGGRRKKRRRGKRWYVCEMREVWDEEKGKV